MGADTAISWTDHTFNPWWGCTKITHPQGSGCDYCYADTLSIRFGHRNLWGKHADRRTLTDANWRKPLVWNRDALATFGRPAFVFCASMGDVFEDRHDLDGHRARLWELINDTPNLVWLLLTKRPEQMTRLAPFAWRNGWPANVWAGASVEHQAAAELRIPRLLKVPAARRFLSVEPMLGTVDLTAAVCRHGVHEGALSDAGIDWVIVGGESGAGHRTLELTWVKGIAAECWANDIALWTKQDSGPLPGQQGRIPDDLWLHQRPDPLPVAA